MDNELQNLIEYLAERDGIFDIWVCKARHITSGCDKQIKLFYNNKDEAIGYLFDAELFGWHLEKLEWRTNGFRRRQCNVQLVKLDK